MFQISVVGEVEGRVFQISVVGKGKGGCSMSA